MEERTNDAAAAAADERFDPRASALLRATTLPVLDLLLDPGDELSLADELSTADDPDVAADAEFMRAFVPMRSYQRLLTTGLDALSSSIARNPSLVATRILVRELTPADADGRHVVIDGSRHVAALRHLAETGAADGVGLSADVIALFDACPVTVVHESTDPAFVLALLADATEPGADPWLQGQRNHLLRTLAAEGVHHSTPTVNQAADGDAQLVRRYHAYRALAQMMQQEPVAVHVACELYPLFHAAMGRAVIRAWLDWDDTLCCSMDDGALELFYRLLAPGRRADGTTRAPCLRTVDDVVHLCDVLAEPAAMRVLVDGGTLTEAVEVINAGAFQVWSSRVGQAFETMKWDRRRFRGRS